jgi:hypothetical protein
LQVLILAGVLTASGAALASAPDEGPPAFPRMSLDQEPPPPAAAPQAAPPQPWRTFELQTGVTYTSITSTILMTRSGGGSGLAVDAEGVLGMDRELLSFDIWTSWRFAERHRLQFRFADLSRASTRTLRTDLELNGVTYNAGDTVDAVYGLQFFDLNYAWSFLKDDRMEICLTFGVDVIRTHLSIDSDLTGREENERFTLPIPLPGLNADFALTPDLWLRQRLQFMYVPVQNYAGLLVNFNMSLEYSVLKNVSLGLGFDLLRIELEKTTSDDTFGSFEGNFRFNSAGLMMSLNFHL